MRYFLLFACALFTLPLLAQNPTDSAYVRANYTKLDRQITMRDGVKLYTLIYVPKDASTTTRNDGPRYPFLMESTPYSAGPCGETK